MRNRGYIYRIYPNKEQKILIDKTIGCSRLIYNSILNHNIEYYKENKKSQFPEVTFFKEKYEFLDEVDSLALANAKINIKKAFNNFFDSRTGKRKGKKSGFPKFKSKKICKLSYTTNNQKGSIRLVEENGKTYIKLPRVGLVELMYHRELIGQIKSATVTHKKKGTYEVSVLTEQEDSQIVNNKKIENLNVVGIDMSFYNFAVLSKEDEKINHPKYYRKAEKKLGRLDRMMRRKVKDSNNRAKSRQILARQSEHVANQRKDFLHKQSRRIVNAYDVIVLEDINLQAMSQQLNFGKSVNDLGFGMFREFLAYKAEDADKFVMIADKWFPSTQICNKCKYKNPLLKDLSIREWTCPECGAHHDRDKNSSDNLEDYFFEEIDKCTDGTSGTAVKSDACGDKPSTLRATLMQVLSLRQEAPCL